MKWIVIFLLFAAFSMFETHCRGSHSPKNVPMSKHPGQWLPVWSKGCSPLAVHWNTFKICPIGTGYIPIWSRGIQFRMVHGVVMFRMIYHTVYHPGDRMCPAAPHVAQAPSRHGPSSPVDDVILQMSFRWCDQHCPRYQHANSLEALDAAKEPLKTQDKQFERCNYELGFDKCVCTSKMKIRGGGAIYVTDEHWRTRKLNPGGNVKTMS